MNDSERRLEAEIEETMLIDYGLLDPDQPTLASHRRHTERMEAEFTARDRAHIRFLILRVEGA